MTRASAVAEPPWVPTGDELRVSSGVHRPSTFSRLLAANLPPLDGASIVDVGSGCGLVTVAALARGARHVVALDHDGAALEDTRDNVSRLLGSDATACLSTWQGDWRDLDLLRTDLAVANPPQRPPEVLAATPREERQLHDGGHDGLAAVRTLVATVRSDRLLLTATSLLRSTPAEAIPHAFPIATAVLDHAPAWSVLGSCNAPVAIWSISRHAPV